MAEPKPTLGRAVVLPTVVAAVGFGVLGLFLSTFLRDGGVLALGLIAAWASFGIGRMLGFADRPRGYGLVARHVLTGVAFGLAGWAFLRGVFVEGPAVWALVAGAGFGIYRSHRALLKDASERQDGRRWLRLFHPKDVQALVVLLAGYAIVGLAGFMILGSLLRFVPGSGQMLAVATAAYALHGARLLLGFAAEERGTTEGGVVGWLKANALQNAIVVLILVGYAVFRGRLAPAIPYFPLVEFGLGVAVFGFVLARLRAKMRKEGSLLATSSDARDHERVLSELREPDYDVVARPVTRFIETGLGKDEYANVVAPASPDARATILAHREPPRPPPIALEWALAAGGAMSLALAIAAYVLGRALLQAEPPFPLILALLFASFGVYAQQDAARAHHRPRLAVGLAAAGTALLFIDFLVFAAEVGELRDVPGIAWGGVALVASVMLGVPALAAWRQIKRMEQGNVVDARRLAPALELSRELQRTRKRAATMALTAFVILLPAPWLAGWLAERGIIPSGFPSFFDDVLAVAIWIVAAFGASALVRFYGLTRERPALVAREKAKREHRLTLHRQVMSALERS